MSPARQPVIIGIGETDYAFDSGRSDLQLAAEASLAAIRDAAMGTDEVDGLVTFTLDVNDEMDLQRCLGMPLLRWSGRSPFGGAGCTNSIQLAAAAIAAEYADAVLVYRALNGRSGKRYGTAAAARSVGSGGELHYAMGMDTAAKSYAAETQGYMRRYGVSSEDLGRYVVATRALAATNPRAMRFGKPLSLAEHQASRWIAEPWIRRYDCCLETDGGVALIVTSREKAQSLGGPSVAIRAAAQVYGPGRRIAYDVYRAPDEIAAEKAALVIELTRQAGIRPRDVDVALLYDAFSPGVFMALEDFGICAAGEARDFINAGETALDGAMPVNPNGGLIGEAYMHGVNNIVEAVRQLRGTAANQVSGAQTALVSGGGGLVLARE